MDNKRFELLHWAVTQHQFVKGFDPNNAKECYDKVFLSYKRLYDKVVNYCVLSDEKEPDEQIPEQPMLDAWEKRGNWTRTNEWRKHRDAQIRKLYKEAKEKHATINNDLFKRIAQITGSTSPKVKEIINELQFNEL